MSSGVSDEAVERVHEFLQKWAEGSVIAWAGGRSLRYEDVASLLGTRPQPTLDMDAVREQIADWYYAHYNAEHDRFYEKNDTGPLSDLDDGATHAYRGAKFAASTVRPLPTREQIDGVLEEHKVGGFAGGDTACECDLTWRKNDAYREHLRDAVLALMGGAE